MSAQEKNPTPHNRKGTSAMFAMAGLGGAIVMSGWGYLTLIRKGSDTVDD